MVAAAGVLAGMALVLAVGLKTSPLQYTEVREENKFLEDVNLEGVDNKGVEF